MTNIKMVADITDIYTVNVLRQYWNNLSLIQRKNVLDKHKFSHKYANSAFDDLTHAIQSKIIIGEKEIF